MEMQTQRFNSKISRTFLSMIVLLAILMFINDHYLKYTYSNILTGKLSDFIGLLIFPLFFSFFFGKHLVKILFITGLGFVYYKSPLADSFIHWFNDFMPYQIQRTVDYSDYIALLSLPLAFVLFNLLTKKRTTKPVNEWVKNISFCFLVLTFFSTSKVPAYYPINGNLKLSNQYEVSYDENRIIEILSDLGNEIVKDSVYITEDGVYNYEPYYQMKWMSIIPAKYPDTIKNVNFRISYNGHEKSKIQFLNAQLSDEWKMQDPTFIADRKKYIENKIKKELMDPILKSVN